MRGGAVHGLAEALRDERRQDTAAANKASRRNRHEDGERHST
jgi:hypothetical protein